MQKANSKQLFRGIDVGKDKNPHLLPPYLRPQGLPIGANMSRSANWFPLLDRFQKRLSSWKARSLSFGGRLTLSKPVLGRGLMDPSSIRSKSGPWCQIAKLNKDINVHGMDLHSLFKKKVGNGETTGFWTEKWIGNSPLRYSFLRLFRLESQPNCRVCEWAPIIGLHMSSVGPSGLPRIIFSWAWSRLPRTPADFSELLELESLISNLQITSDHDKWECLIDPSRNFTVKGMRNDISNTLTPSNPSPTRWNKLVPIKVNIAAWRIEKRRIPTKVNLDLRGIDLHSVRCSICDEDLETKDHLLKKNPGKTPIESDLTNLAIFVELNSLVSASNTHIILLDQGFEDFNIKYIGGLHLLIKFNHQSDVTNGMSNEKLISHFKSMIPWNTNTRTTKRLVWISIAGLPSQLWHSDNYGEILIKEDCSPRQFNITHGKIRRCNLRILTRPQPSNSAESVEVNKTVNIGNQLGFGMTGKEADVSSIVLQIVQFLVGDGFIAVKGIWISIDSPCLLIVVYAPQCIQKKKILWATLHNIITVNDCLTITLGDFNEVRNALERSGSVFHHRGAINFNDFISSSGLSDLPLGGLRYTRMDKLGSKLSKLDRFLVSPHVLDKWPSAHAISLVREYSDHSPILFQATTDDYGPIPFRFYNSWLTKDDFWPTIQGCWATANCSTSVTLRETLNNLDLKVESSPLSIIDINLRANSVKELLEIDQKRPKTSAKKQDLDGVGPLSLNERLNNNNSKTDFY
ncbi:cytochrome P450 [Tanacetum coccineum]